MQSDACFERIPLSVLLSVYDRVRSRKKTEDLRLTWTQVGGRKIIRTNRIPKLKDNKWKKNGRLFTFSVLVVLIEHTLLASSLSLSFSRSRSFSSSIPFSLSFISVYIGCTSSDDLNCDRWSSVIVSSVTSLAYFRAVSTIPGIAEWEAAARTASYLITGRVEEDDDDDEGMPSSWGWSAETPK